MKISVLIACLNDTPELVNTIGSILFHATNVEIIVVDDCSSNPIPPAVIAPGCGLVHRNKRRLGVGPSRHLAACLATGDIIFIVDSHCRFTPGWDAELRESLRAAPATLICGSMIAFDSNTPFASGKPYYGASWNFVGKDQKGKPQFFECVWQNYNAEKNYAIPAPMGACYGMMRNEYMRLGGLQYLRSWGCDEQVLSLKFWLCNGGVILNTDLRIGHKFRIGKERVPFPISELDKLYNKMFAIFTLLPESRAKILFDKIPGNMTKNAAFKELVKNWGIVTAEQQHNIRLADGKLNERFDNFLSRFNLTFPNT